MHVKILHHIIMLELHEWLSGLGGRLASGRPRVGIPDIVAGFESECLRGRSRWLTSGRSQVFEIVMLSKVPSSSAVLSTCRKPKSVMKPYNVSILGSCWIVVSIFVLYYLNKIMYVYVYRDDLSVLRSY